MRILILSRNKALYSTQSLIRASEKRGHQVQVYDHLMCNIVVECNRSKVMIGIDDLENYDAIIPRIGASATQYGAAIVRQLELTGSFVTVTAESLLKARDKLHCLQLLAAAGIDVPKTGISAGDYCIPAVHDRISDNRSVIKLIASTQGLGVILSNSRNQGISIVEGFHRVGQDVLIQEFIEDAGGADIRAFVVNGRVVAAMKRQAIPGEFRSNIHRGASAEPIRLSAVEERIAVQSTAILGLSIAGVDILRSKRGPLVLEVNASPGLEGIEGSTGVDVAGQINEFIENMI